MKVGVDLFSYGGSSNLLVVDYFSNFVEVKQLKESNSKEVIGSLKEIFSRNGIPKLLMSDQGP